MVRVTPARQQYLDTKAAYPDCIVFFRMGDFYEMFDEDAVTAAEELDLTLTSRATGKDQARIPMAGVPYHAAEAYIARLIEKGYHVAICDQVSEPDGRGIVDREVTRVITPGTILEPDMLAQGVANYLMAIAPVAGAQDTWLQAGIAYVDVSTGEFRATSLSGEDVPLQVLEELSRVAPREVLLPATWADKGLTLPNGMHLSVGDDWLFEPAGARQLLLSHFGVATLDGFGLGDNPPAVMAAGGLLSYVRHNQRQTLRQITSIHTYNTGAFLAIDPFTRRNLELTETLRSRQTGGSLLWVLDRTVTAMGARLLRSWMSQPLLERQRIQNRLDAIEVFFHDNLLRTEIRQGLRSIADIERLTNRIVLHHARPDEVLALRDSLALLPEIVAQIADRPALRSILDHLDPCSDLVTAISQAIAEEPPRALNATGVIRPGYATELDDLLAATKDARDWIAGLEGSERKRTGIANLKVSFNRVFGYYIEISRAQTANVPDDYIRKQTLVNAERYVTPELKEYETLVLNAEEEILALERRLFGEFLDVIAPHSPRLLRAGRAVALLDVFQSLADVAVRENYVRPAITEDNVLDIQDGRHPVVERLLADNGRYTPNTTTFSHHSRIHIITGPNMSGKSTYIRQVALIVFMAQIGSFVPASAATVGLVDRIFARIGAQDEIHAGQSTFMVEMVETARVLTGSTRRSLLILDEIGRGTSTYDGMAIARAVIEYIHEDAGLNCRTLFATHYHELTDLPNTLVRCENFSVAVAEEGDRVVFLHRVIPGGADKSYGIHVAQLAGLPRPVIERARQLLIHLEAEHERTAAHRERRPAASPAMPAARHPALEGLAALNIEEMTPLQALTILNELRQMIDEPRR
jgi:DNA mismatch repair protein MutS